MKQLFLLLLAAALLALQPVFAQGNVDNISCIGNGHMAVYESKADILQLFGPPYSSPSLLKMVLEDTTIQVRSTREPGTAIWVHELRRNGTLIGTITDLVDAESPVLIRKFNLNSPVSFSLSFTDKIRIIPNTASYITSAVTDALLAESPRGIAFYNDYPMPFKQCLQVVGRQGVHIQQKPQPGNGHPDNSHPNPNSIHPDPDSGHLNSGHPDPRSGLDGNQYTVNVEPGEGTLYLAGGPLYPECISNAHAALASSYNTMLQHTRAWWQKFTARRLDFARLLPANTPDRERLLQTIDAVAVNCKTQQGVEGGVLAGHNYHLGYVRDEYGVSRCLLKLGYYPEARGILHFFWKVWEKNGQLHNAQGIGIDAFHVHENDEVEITGYLIIQAFDYLEKTGDKAFIKQIFPMLEWAWLSEKKNLAKNMLPFNGDETYVAGGILPRSCLIDGSAEATLLFITGGAKLIACAEKNQWWNAALVGQNRQVLRETIRHYRENFFHQGHLYCNNPGRTKGLSFPAFRHGVCEAQGPGCEFYGWTQKNENDRYLCPVCFARMDLPRTIPKTYLIQSVSLMPLYMGATLFSHTEIDSMTAEIISSYHRTGRLPSRPDGNTTVGYDYGLLLFNLTHLGSPSQKEIYEKMLSLLDDTGSWVEYYTNGRPTGTRYRPWESSINLEAAIDYAENVKP